MATNKKTKTATKKTAKPATKKKTNSKAKSLPLKKVKKKAIKVKSVRFQALSKSFNLADHVIDFSQLHSSNYIFAKQNKSGCQVVDAIDITAEFVWMSVKVNGTTRTVWFETNIANPPANERNYTIRTVNDPSGKKNIFRISHNNFGGGGTGTKWIGSDDFRNDYTAAVGEFVNLNTSHVGFYKNGNTLYVRYLSTNFKGHAMTTANCQAITANTHLQGNPNPPCLNVPCSNWQGY